MSDEDFKLPRAHTAKLAAAAAEPGTKIDMGDIVVCDYCEKDYRGLPDSGGLIFQSKAICPTCAPEARKSIRRFGEERYIRAECPDGVPFQQFVLGYRAERGSNYVQVLTGDDAFAALRPPPVSVAAEADGAGWRAPMTREQQFALLDTTHTYGCNCDVCLTWWALMGPDGDDPGDYGPFEKEQVNARQRAIGVEVTS